MSSIKDCYKRIGAVPHCDAIEWTDGQQRIVSKVREIAFPPRGGVVRHGYVLDAPNMPPAIMTRLCRELGISAALSWLASHSATLHGG